MPVPSPAAPAKERTRPGRCLDWPYGRETVRMLGPAQCRLLLEGLYGNEQENPERVDFEAGGKHRIQTSQRPEIFEGREDGRCFSFDAARRDEEEVVSERRLIEITHEVGITISPEIWRLLASLMSPMFGASTFFTRSSATSQPTEAHRTATHGDSRVRCFQLESGCRLSSHSMMTSSTLITRPGNPAPRWWSARCWCRRRRRCCIRR